MAMDEPTPDDLRPITELCDGPVSYRIDGWRRLVHMEGLRFLVGTKSVTMDALLCLNHDNSTYPTKLYLTEPVGAGLNWNENAFILGRQWHTFSWRDISPSLPVKEILALHLAPLGKAQAA